MGRWNSVANKHTPERIQPHNSLQNGKNPPEVVYVIVSFHICSYHSADYNTNIQIYLLMTKRL